MYLVRILFLFLWCLIVVLCEFLFDEEGLEVGELLGVGNVEGGELDKYLVNYMVVGGFGLIFEFGFMFLF